VISKPGAYRPSDPSKGSEVRKPSKTREICVFLMFMTVYLREQKVETNLKCQAKGIVQEMTRLHNFRQMNFK
jgi:hypothetical protein